MHPHNVLVTVTGFDRPGVTSALFAALAAHDVEVLDVEQVVIRGRLVLGVALALHGDPGLLRRAATLAAEALGTEIEVTITEEPAEPPAPPRSRHHVIVLGRPLRAGALGEIARRISDLGGNLEAISRLGDDPYVGLELMVSGADHGGLAATLVMVARETGTDIAIERAELRRRSKRLVLLDADRTLIPTDTLGLLAELAGHGAESARLAEAVREAELAGGRPAGRPPGQPGAHPTAHPTTQPSGEPVATEAGRTGPVEAGSGSPGANGSTGGTPGAAGPGGAEDGRRPRLDEALPGTTNRGAAPAGGGQANQAGQAGREAELLRARVALLAGLPVTALEQVREGLRWAPGADELVGTLQRMGYRCGAVSGGAAQVVEPLLDGLGLDFAVANRLEISGRRLTGRLVDGVLDPFSKAQALARFAEAYGVPLSQTVAVGGPGGTDMVARAGLGVAVGADAPAGSADPAGSEPAPTGTDRGSGDGEVSYVDVLLVVLGLRGPDSGESRVSAPPAK